MALKNVANEDLTFQVDFVSAAGSAPVPPLNQGTVSVVTPPSLKVKAPGGLTPKGVWGGPIQISLSGFSYGSITGAFGVATINPSALKTKVDMGILPSPAPDPVIREEDEVLSVTLTGADAGMPPFPGVGTIVVNVKIANAGQTKFKAQ